MPLQLQLQLRHPALRRQGARLPEQGSTGLRARSKIQKEAGMYTEAHNRTQEGLPCYFISMTTPRDQHCKSLSAVK